MSLLRVRGEEEREEEEEELACVGVNWHLARIESLFSQEGLGTRGTLNTTLEAVFFKRKNERSD